MLYYKESFELSSRPPNLIVIGGWKQEKGGLARAINEKILRLSKLSKPGSPGRTWIDHDENGLLRNVM